MGNCNCLKMTPLDSKLKTDVNVEDDLNNDKSSLSEGNANNKSLEKKTSPRGVSNPTQNGLKKNIKSDNVINNNYRSIKEDTDTIKKKATIKDDKINSTKSLNKKDDCKEENVELKEKKELNRAPQRQMSLTEIIKQKNFKIINGDRKSINVVLLGDRCVGKTSIIYQYTSNKFDQYYITTIFKEDFSKPITIGNKKYNMNFTVTSGDPQYQGDYTNIYKNCDFFVMVFDLTLPQSFDKIKEILKKEILQYANLYKENYMNVILIANKSDLKSRKISAEEINQFCEKYCLDYFEVSAKNNINISRIFSKLAEVYDEVVPKS